MAKNSFVVEVTFKVHRKSVKKKPTVKRCLLIESILWQRTPESSCARKETTDVDILAKCRNGDRKIIQSNRITSGPPSRIRNQLSQIR